MGSDRLPLNKDHHDQKCAKASGDRWKLLESKCFVSTVVCSPELIEIDMWMKSDLKPLYESSIDCMPQLLDVHAKDKRNDGTDLQQWLDSLVL